VSDSDLERAALLASARAYVEWELEVSGFGLPAASLRSEAHVSDQQSASARTAEARSAAPAALPAIAQPSSPNAAMPLGGLAASSPASVPRATLAGLAQGEADGAGTPAPAPTPDRRVRLLALEESVRSCTRCELAKSRTKTVFARGNPDSPVVFIGEGPGQEEDRSGLPFVGPAGQLLDRMVAAMGFTRDDVYICNVVKCRPPGNRTPLPSEAGACAPFLLGQLEAIQPRVIVALGRCATENLGLVGDGGGWRGRWGKFQGVDVMPTYHPAFLLRSPEFKRPVWEDLQKVMGRLKQPS